MFPTQRAQVRPLTRELRPRTQFSRQYKQAECEHEIESPSPSVFDFDSSESENEIQVQEILCC